MKELPGHLYLCGVQRDRRRVKLRDVQQCGDCPLVPEREGDRGRAARSHDASGGRAELEQGCAPDGLEGGGRTDQNPQKQGGPHDGRASPEWSNSSDPIADKLDSPHSAVRKQRDQKALRGVKLQSGGERGVRENSGRNSEHRNSREDEKNVVGTHKHLATDRGEPAHEPPDSGLEGEDKADAGKRATLLDATEHLEEKGDTVITGNESPCTQNGR